MSHCQRMHSISTCSCQALGAPHMRGWPLSRAAQAAAALWQTAACCLPRSSEDNVHQHVVSLRQTRPLPCSIVCRLHVPYICSGTHCKGAVDAQALWAGLVERHGGRLEPAFDLSTLAHLSEGYASGTIDQARPDRHGLASCCPGCRCSPCNTNAL